MRARRGQTTRPQDKPVDGPCGVRGFPTAPRPSLRPDALRLPNSRLNFDQQQDGQDLARQQRRGLTALDALVGDLVRKPRQKRPAVTSWR